MTVHITPARIGFGGCVPPAGVNPANANSVKAPVVKPSFTSPRIKPVIVETISGRKIKNDSNQKSMPKIIAAIDSNNPCINVISILISSII